MDRTEAERILAALKSGTPLISRHKAAEALEWALGPRWISVEERLPDDGETVLVCSDKNNVMTAYYDAIFNWKDDDGNLYVAHWQPLPAGPGVRDE